MRDDALYISDILKTSRWRMMNMQVVDWQAHYKAVRHRIAQAAIPSRLKLAVELYDSPIGPTRAKAVTRYATPIGPYRPITPIYIGYVVYKKSGDHYFFELVRKCARSHRPRHTSDVRAYNLPIGPHNCAKSCKADQPLHTGRDLLLVGSAAPYVPTGQKIIAEVCEEFKVSQLDLLSKRRTADLVKPRFRVAYRLKTETLLSLAGIGRLLNRDHTSIIHALRRYQSEAPDAAIVEA